MEPFERAVYAGLMAMGCIALFHLAIWAGVIGMVIILLTMGLMEDEYLDYDEDFDFDTDD